VLSFALARLSC